MGNIITDYTNGIKELNAADWNIIAGNNARHCTNNVVIVGGNTVVTAVNL